MKYEAIQDFTVRQNDKRYSVTAAEVWTLAEERGDEITLYKYNNQGKVDTITLERKYLVKLFKAV